MSLEHAKTMLKTIKQYSNSEISLTFNDNRSTPILCVCYKGSYFEITNLRTSDIKTFNDVESTIVFIETELHDKVLHPSNC
ncbi:hypothetical protein D0466_18445 [Peribacillus glennii]|uniref:DUF1797 family protein n=1 Tax=Peribacillus glennii TaxID=2303991 RepID=A0A372L7H3_9BACI|nr:hypothetical protein D0466_18445 [Peribacillus glennii]